MPQTPYNAQNSILTTAGGQFNKLNITTITAVKTIPGRIATVVINAANSTAVKVYDTNATASAAAANQIYIGTSTGVVGTVVTLNFPCLTGIVVDPGTGGNVSVSYL